MSIKEIKSIKTEKKELRKFGIAFSLILAVLGVLLLWRGRDYYYYFFILSAASLFLGLFLPFVLKPVHQISKTLSILMSWFVTRVILIVLFYLIVTPIGLLMKLFGKNLLDLKFDKNTDSYWITRKTLKYEKKNYENQF